MNRRTAMFLMSWFSRSGARLWGAPAPRIPMPGQAPENGPAWQVQFARGSTGLALRGQTPGGLEGPTARQSLMLDGTWQIVFDEDNTGGAQGWHQRARFDALAAKRTIQVPNCWETIEKDYEGVAWYGLHFQVPEAWKDRVIRLQFDAVNYRSEVWVNDHPVGFHDGGYTPFEILVGDFLNFGQDNFLAVRVIGPLITRQVNIDGFGFNETPHWRGAITGGIWQSVQLVATEQAFFSSLYVQPQVRERRAVILADIENKSTQTLAADVEFALSGESETVRRSISLRPGPNSVQAQIEMQKPRLWSLESPELYQVRADLSTKEGGRDQVDQHFGMREFTVNGSSFYLNGKKIHVKAAFWEGLYPNTLAFPPNADMVRREIRLAKEAGFNVLRLWRKPPAPMILDLADEMGMMIIDAPPIECMGFWPQLTPELDHRIAIEVRELVKRDRNHPSVIYWEIFNEILRPEIARLKPGMSELARTEDASRIVVDESGGWAGGCHACLPFRDDSVPINEIHSYLPAPVSPRTYNFYLTLGQPGFDASMLSRSKMPAPEGVIFVSEVGYGGLPDFPAVVDQYHREGNPLTPDYRYNSDLLKQIGAAMDELQWGELFHDAQALCQASQQIQAEGNKLQLEALRLNPRISGYCLHAYTDGDWVLGAGLLDLFRNTKQAYHSVKHVQTPLYIAARVNPSNLREGQIGALSIDSVNDGDSVRGHLEWQVAAPGGHIVRSDGHDVSINAGVSSQVKINLPPLNLSGVHTVRVRFTPASGTAFENEQQFFHLSKKDLEPPKVRFAVVDPNREITRYLEERKLRFHEFTGSEHELLPVLVLTDTPPDGESLMAHVARGGTAVFLKPPAVPLAKHGADSASSPAWFPLQLTRRSARGNWAPVNHGVRSHPIFAGLPTGGFMNQVYLNVCANESLVGVKVPPLVGSLSYVYESGFFDHLHLNYHGPGPIWWGADLVAVPHGKGRMLLSMLHLKENLSSDPVAEKLFYNIIQWSSSRAGQSQSSLERTPLPKYAYR